MVASKYWAVCLSGPSAEDNVRLSLAAFDRVAAASLAAVLTQAPQDGSTGQTAKKAPAILQAAVEVQSKRRQIAKLGWADRLNALRIPNSGEVDRYWFRSLYCRGPNGVLFEIAMDGPGFAADEDVTILGEKVVLPPFLEPRRTEILVDLKPFDYPASSVFKLILRG